MATRLQQSAVVRAVNRVGAAVGRLGLRPGLDPDALLAAASASIGSDDFGDDRFRAGFERLVAELDGPARLNTIGRIAARTRLQRLLETRLGILAHRRAHPEVAAAPVERPIFVVGLPRTGTTLLYGLLAADPAHRSPVSWEVAYPFPPPRREDRATDPRIARCDREFDQFRRVAPGIDAIHPLGARLPQECLALQAPEFLSYEFPTTFPVPAYDAWLQQQDLRRAYGFQRMFLQHLQSGYGGRHWVLKTPAHLLWTRTLLEEFPDALIVQTHRDPATVLASVSSLMFALRSAVSDHVDAAAVGREQLETWSTALDRAVAIRDTLDDDRVVDVHFEDTVSDPVGTVRRIYEHFDLDLSGAAVDGIERYVADNPRRKHGTHAYELDDFGIDRGEADARFAGYRDRFLGGRP